MPPKRPRDESGSETPTPQPKRQQIAKGKATAAHRSQFADDFVQQVITELQQLQAAQAAATTAPDAVPTHGERATRNILEILLHAQPPTVDTKSTRDAEALFLDADVAKAHIASANYIPEVPIIVNNDRHPSLPQADPSTGTKRPIETFFDWMDDLDRSNAVQVPSRPSSDTSYAKIKLLDIKTKFLANQNQDPWNVLDLHNPLPSSLPPFLQGINTTLLHSIRDDNLKGKSGERTEATPKAWSSWRNIVDWALLAEGGCLTAPHTDANGLETWITVQEGNFGFGWKPKDQTEQDEWIADPLESTDGEWRYLVLQPGQTVFFGTGLIHYVFRLRDTQTLALGGHILRWNGVCDWIDTLMNQLEHPDMINEDMDDTARKYVASVKKLVKQRIDQGMERVVCDGLKEAFVEFKVKIKVCFVPPPPFLFGLIPFQHPPSTNLRVLTRRYNVGVRRRRQGDDREQGRRNRRSKEGGCRCKEDGRRCQEEEEGPRTQVKNTSMGFAEPHPEVTVIFRFWGGGVSFCSGVWFHAFGLPVAFFFWPFFVSRTRLT